LNTDIVLSKLETARNALAEARTIQDTKKILDIAAAAEIYAKRQQLGEEAIQYATSIKIEALAQLGRMLQNTERATGGVAQRTRYSKVTELDPPTLAEMGLDKKTSKLAQDIADLPEEQFEAVKQGVLSINKAQKIAKAKDRTEKRAEIARAGASVKPSDRWNVWQADIQEWQAPRQYDFIITDPPYPKEYLHLYEVLAHRAIDWLKPGGLVIAMAGQSYLDEVYKSMSQHLKYYWTACYLTPGASASLRQKQVNTQWKPLLIYGLNEDKYSGKIFNDVFTSGENDKDHHKWGQSISGMYDIISKICLPGQYILDPFCGAGTTLLTAVRYGCFADGIDLTVENVNISKGRLDDETKNNK